MPKSVRPKGKLPVRLEPDYTDVDQPSGIDKDRYLKDGRRYIKDVGLFLQDLAGFGPALEVSVNPAGDVCSGEVYGYFPINDHQLLMVVLDQMPALWNKRPDAINVRALVAEYTLTSGKKGQRGFKVGTMGRNNFLSPGVDAREMAQKLLTLLKGQGVMLASFVMDGAGRPDPAYGFGIDRDYLAPPKPQPTAAIQLDLFGGLP